MTLTKPNSIQVGVALSLGAATALPAAAQQTTENTGEQVVLDTILLDAVSANANDATTGTGARMLGGTVRETPQVVTVVPAEVIRQKNITTLEEALRNVPGITLSTGEGRGGSNGEQYRLRGLTAKGDIYNSGLRDFGAYTHDTFNVDSVSVIKGPSGEAFGSGNLGGVINQVSKRAHLGDANEVSGTIASGLRTRETLDMNRQLTDTSAIRFNLMNQNGYAADRDHVTVKRQGLAVAYGMGLGTDMEWHVGYQYLKGKGKPDYGQPMGEDSDGKYRPLQEFGIPGYDRDVSYVRSTDKDDTEAHMLTSSFSYKVAPGFTITNDTRFSRFERDFSGTNPATCDAACIAGLRAGIDQPLRYGAGGGMTYKQKGWGFQNLTAAQLEFETGALRHKAMVGLDITYQGDDRTSGSWEGRTSDQTILHPRYGYPDARVTYDYAGKTRAKSHSIGVLFGDRVWFNKQWSVQATARADYFKSTFDGAVIGGSETVHGKSETKRLSPSVSLMFEPDANTMAYFSVSRTWRPLGTDIAAAVNSFEPPTSDAKYQPERSDNVELGGKMDLFGGTLGLNGAIFQTRKKNSFTVNDDGTVTNGGLDAGQAIRVRGVELGATGNITSDWTVMAAYAWLDGEVQGGKGTRPENEGNDAPGVSRNNISLWTNYNLPGAMTNLPGQLSVGAGVTYASKYYADAGNEAQIPSALSLDASIGYETDAYRVTFSANNLTDHDNYSSAFNAVRAVPMAGRNFALTVAAKF
ncbi:TonB-dependent receptor [Paenirhodobacter sp.]|uniref:TonB-dependent receptor n=1 Tax=Paenirhodobacter sp. TaxID=1965326 RepID=UPI003B4187A1